MEHHPELRAAMLDLNRARQRLGRASRELVRRAATPLCGLGGPQDRRAAKVATAVTLLVTTTREVGALATMLFDAAGEMGER